MKIQELIQKMLKGETLTDAEKKFMQEYKEPEKADDDDDKNGRIPKDRLDREIAKRNELKKQMDELQAKLDEATEKLDEKENADLSELQKLQKQFEKLQGQFAEKEKAQQEAEKKVSEMEFSSKMSKLASENKYIDSEYLGFQLEKAIAAKELDIDDEKAVKDWFAKRKETKPAEFIADVNTGGAGSEGNAGGSQTDDKTKLAEFNKKESLTPQESIEAMELAMKIEEEAKASADKGENK